MEYETADGSQFSLLEVHAEHEGKETFQYTSVTAFVDGKAFAGKVNQRMNEVDDVDIVNYLKPVPSKNINPPFPKGFTIAPRFDIAEHYLKAPAFTYEDSEPGRTFVADCVLNEATVLETLRKHPHRNIADYYGCVVQEGRITQLCLKRYFCSLAEYSEHRLSDLQRERFFSDVTSAVKHLHSLGLAHNDICPENICIDADGNPALVDFDSCLPFGRRLRKGVAAKTQHGAMELVSDRENDLRGLDDLRDFLEALPLDDGDIDYGQIDGATEAGAKLLPTNMSPEY